MKKVICTILASALVSLAACAPSNGQKVSERADALIPNVSEDISADNINESVINTKDSANQASSTNPLDSANPAGSTGISRIEGYDVIMSDSSLSPENMLKYIKDNISKASAEEASNLLLRLEQLQIDKLEAMTKRYAEDALQAELLKRYDFGTNTVDMEGMGNGRLKELLEDVRNSGYKTETAEGSFFPVLDYSIYKQFTDTVTDDLREYFSLMAVESDNAPAKDASLVIGWDEVIQRALMQQRYISGFGQSKRLDAVKELYKKYVTFIFNGLPNTPDFAYGTGAFSDKLKQSLTDVADNNGTTLLERTIADYLKLLKKNNFKLTGEVKKFRENSITVLSGYVPGC